MSDNFRSKAITEGLERAPNRAMLRAVGFGDGDFSKPIVGIASAHSTITPCNAGLNRLAQRAAKERVIVGDHDPCRWLATHRGHSLAFFARSLALRGHDLKRHRSFRRG